MRTQSWMASFPTSSYPSLSCLSDEEWWLFCCTPGSLSSEHWSQAPWQQVPTEGKHWGWQMWLLEPRHEGWASWSSSLAIIYLSLSAGLWEKQKQRRKKKFSSLHGISSSALSFSTVRTPGDGFAIVLEGDVSWGSPKVLIPTLSPSNPQAHLQEYLCFDYFSNFVFPTCLQETKANVLCKKLTNFPLVVWLVYVSGHHRTQSVLLFNWGDWGGNFPPMTHHRAGNSAFRDSCLWIKMLHLHEVPWNRSHSKWKRWFSMT